MILKYFSFSVSVVFMSFIVGMILTALVKKTSFYQKTLANLNFLENENLNNVVGVGFVKWMVKNTFFKFLNPNLKVEGKINISQLISIRNQMTKAEIDHLFAFFFVAIFVVFKFYKHEYVFASIILAVNILMNLCPTLLQQQNKRRIDNLILKFSR